MATAPEKSQTDVGLSLFVGPDAPKSRTYISAFTAVSACKPAPPMSRLA